MTSSHNYQGLSPIREAGLSIATPRDRNAYRSAASSAEAIPDAVTKRLSVAHTEIVRLHEDTESLKKQEIEIAQLKNVAARAEAACKSKLDHLEMDLERSEKSLQYQERMAASRQEDLQNKVLSLQAKIRQAQSSATEATKKVEAQKREAQMELIETKRQSALAKTADSRKYKELELALQWAEQATKQAEASADARQEESDARLAAMHVQHGNMQEQVAQAENAVFESQKTLLTCEEQLQNSVIEAQHSAGSSEAATSAKYKEVEASLVQTKRRAVMIETSTKLEKNEMKARVIAVRDELFNAREEISQMSSHTVDSGAVANLEQLTNRLQERLQESDETAERLRKEVRDAKGEFLEWQRGDAMLRANTKSERARLEASLASLKQTHELSEVTHATERQHLEAKFSTFQKQEEAKFSTFQKQEIEARSSERQHLEAKFSTFQSQEIEASKKSFSALQETEVSAHEARSAEINALRAAADRELTITEKLQNLEAAYERFKGEMAQAEFVREMAFTAKQEKLEAQIAQLETREKEETDLAEKTEAQLSNVRNDLQTGKDELEEQLNKTNIETNRHAALAKVDVSAKMTKLEQALQRAMKMTVYEEEASRAMQEALEAKVAFVQEDAVQCRREREHSEVTLMARCQEIEKRLKVADARANDSSLHTVQVEADSEARQLELEAEKERLQSFADTQELEASIKYEDLEVQFASSEKRSLSHVEQLQFDLDQLEKEKLATRRAVQEADEAATDKCQKLMTSLYEEEQRCLAIQQEEVTSATRSKSLEAKLENTELSLSTAEEKLNNLTVVAKQLQQGRMKAKGEGKGTASTPKMSAAREDRLYRIFMMCERNEDGKIGRKELAKLVKQNKGVAHFFRLPADDAEAIDVFFSSTDKNKDDCISWEELKDQVSQAL